MKQKLLFFSPERQLLEVAVCIAKSSEVHLDCGEVLSQMEKRKYATFKTTSGKSGYLLGRYCAKQAYLHLAKSRSTLRSIEIVNGIFEQPVLRK